jgi:DOPA 4,5-dioxygenase
MMPDTTTRDAAPAPENTQAITSYHAHIYYDPVATKDRAERIRERVAARFPQARVGRWHDELVGPHLRSMYQLVIPSEIMALFLPWIMLNRDGLTILLHPESGNGYRDHTAHAAWFGAVLPLRLDVFKDGPTD